MGERSVTVVVLCSLALGACGYTTREVADPPTITLKTALIDVADSIDALRQRTSQRQKAGLLVDEVTVTFDVSSKATDGNKLGITTTNIPIGNAVGGLSGELSSASEGNRGNQIVVKLKNVATADMSKGLNQSIIESASVPALPRSAPS